MENSQNNQFNMRRILILTSLHIGVLSFFLPIYSKELKMSATEIGGLFSIISFMIIILRPFIGKLIDNIGRKHVLCIGIILQCVSYLLLAEAETSLILYIARTVQGLSAAFMGISIDAIIADTHTDSDISEGFGKAGSAYSTGNIYGCILATVVLYRLPFLQGWKVLFLIFTLCSFYGFIKVMSNFKEEKRKVVNKNISFKNYSKDTKKLLVIVFITCLFSSMISPIFIIYLQDKITNDLLFLAVSFFPAIIINSIYARRIGRLSDKIGKIKSMMIGIAVSGAVILLIPSLNSIFMFALIWTVSSIGGTLYDLSESGLYTQLNSENDNGEIFGVYTFVCNLSSMIGPLLGGYLYDRISIQSPFYFNGAGLIIVAILIPILLKKNE